MTSIAYSPISIQTAEHSSPLPPPWFGEVVLMVGHLRKQGVLNAITQQVRFARRRFGRYEVIDFVAVLFGYAISGERTLEAFYQAVQPWEEPFMALFDREKLPSRSALSRFLASVSFEATEALRSLFLADLLARPLDKERHTGQLVDRAGNAHVVIDLDGTLASRSTTRCATDRRTACTTAPLQPGLCSGLHRAQARGGRAYPHRCLSGSQLPVARQFRQPRQWTLPGGTPPRADCRQELSGGTPSVSGVGPGASRWAIWDRSRHRRFVRLAVRDALAVITPCWIRSRSRAACTCLPTSSSAVRRVAWCASSTTVQMSRWGRRATAAVSWWRPIPLPRKRAGLVTPARASSMNSFSRISRKTRSPPPMWWRSTCIVAPLSRCLQMKTTSKIPTAGVATRPLGKKPGRSSRNGFGMCAWNWGISLSRQRCAPPSLRELCPRPKRSSPLPGAMASLRLPHPSKLAASLGRTLPSSRTEQCTVPLVNRWLRTNNVEKPMEASG